MNILKKCSSIVWVILVVTGISLSLACNLENKEATDKSYQYKIPKSIDDGWEIADISSVGIKGESLEEFVEKRNNGSFERVFSVSIAKDGKLVFDEYFPGIDTYNQRINPGETYLQDLQSSTKSIASVAIGAAKYSGFPIDLDESYAKIFKDYPVDWSGKKGEIKLIHALTMSTGLDWDEWSTSYENGNSLSAMDDEAYSQGGDPLNYLFNLDCRYTPGTYFAYCSGASVSLGEVIRRKTGLYIDEFLSQYVFEPMNIKNSRWIKYPNGMPHTGGGLYLRARDLLKFGQMFLNGGIWNGKRIILEEWVKLSTHSHIKTGLVFEWETYGLQWWINTYNYQSKTYNAYQTSGNGGQAVIVIPELNLVIGFTGGYYGQASNSIHRTMVVNYILPACVD